jgi:hypothetical protein
MQSLQLDDSLKLTFCPRCDYSLHGLPDTGVCPECGNAYNTDFLILRGKPVTLGDEPNGRRYFSISTLVGWAAMMPVLWMVILMRFPTPLFILLVVSLACEIVQSLVPWFFSTRGRDAVVWLCSAGIGEQPLVDADSLAGKFLHYTAIFQAVAVFPTAVFLICVLLSPENTAIGIILLVVLLFFCYLLHLGRKPTPALRAKGVRPALLPWRSFGEIEIEELGGRSFQLWARKRESTRIRLGDVIKIEFSASAIGGAQLVHLLRQWCGSSVVVSFKVLDRSPGPRVARSAGLWTARILRLVPRTRRRE